MMSSKKGGYALHIESLPQSVIARILSYGERDMLQRAGCVSKSMIIADNTWRALCVYRFNVHTTMQLWPVFKTWKRLYRVLDKWMPACGFYVLASASPWGLLFIFRFIEGKFVGEVLWQDGRRDISASADGEGTICASHCVRLPRTRVVEVIFTEEENKSNVTILGDAIKSLALSNDEVILQSNRVISGGIQIPNLHIAPGCLVARLAESPRNLLFQTFPFQRDSIVRDMMKAWNPNSRNRSGAEDVQQMLRTLIDQQKRSSESALVFQYVDGPRSHSSVYREGMPLIRPGLYSGSYNLMYGKFRREILLVQYKRYVIEPGREDATWKQIGIEMFNTKFQRDPEGTRALLRQQITRSAASEVVFATGRKVTGDVHVTMGQLTWAALVWPAFEEDSDEYRGLRDVAERGHPSRRYPVVRTFFGWGCLAAPGFTNPSWNQGRLVQIDPGLRARSGDRDIHSFAFLWGRDGGDDVSLLRWLDIQERLPFSFVRDDSSDEKDAIASSASTTPATKSS
eukprot:g2563.t1